MQSPQKLRERLRHEHEAISNAGSALQAELKQIGEELHRTSTGRGHQRTQSVQSTPDMSAKGMETRLAALSAKHVAALKTLKSQLDDLGKTVSSSLLVSEQRAQKLDHDLKEKEEELTVLYSSVNQRLDAVFQQVQGGKGMEEMKKRVEASEAEKEKLRRENFRLKREVAGLRAQLKE
jgi:hypothetical protein